MLDVATHPAKPSSDVLDAVEAWARPGARLLREVELIGNDRSEAEVGVHGRADGLLVPVVPWECGWRPKRGWCWDGCSLAGVEVKISRGDFRKGLETGQFDRYRRVLGALFVAVPRWLACDVLRDLPAGVSLIVTEPCEIARCVRQAKATPTTVSPQMFWKVLHLLDAESRVREHAADRAKVDILDRVGHHASAAIRGALKAIEVRA